MKLYGCEAVTALTAETVRKHREPHSVMITGEAGLGKKTMARYYAAQLMCERHDGTPCWRCRSCDMIDRGVHPDVITLTPNDKGNYAVEDIRERVVADAAVYPNEGDIKVYIIPDMDRSRITSAQIQNILLKLIEEPPDHVAVIVTAAGKESFLPTVISRTLCLGMVHVTDRESGDYLQENYPETSPADIAEAVRAGRGNIGRCREYLEKGPFYNAVQTARSIAAAIVSGNEYELIKALSVADGKRDLLRSSISLLAEIVRDAGAVAVGSDVAMTGCDENAAHKLSGRLLPSELGRMYELLREYESRVDHNGNVGLNIADLTGHLAGLVC